MTVTRLMIWATIALALLGTLMLYNQPGFLVNLADQFWSCF
ncbi:hypothetical protein [Hydrogenophaga sp.]|nr:hypothetical protein [Hydrogenophaga sp.]MDO8904860.1 hypothetical protein [Hydrogenophaga sp.]